MAGPQTTQILDARSYAAFTQLAHAFSKVVIAPIASIEGAAQLMVKLSEQLPEDAGAASLTTAATALRDAARQGLADTRQCFWPDGSRSGPTLESRWFPYDTRAWDRFFGEVAGLLRPYLLQIGDGIQQIQAVGSAGGQEASWRTALPIAVTAYERLRAATTVAGFEAQLFRERPPAQEPPEQ